MLLGGCLDNDQKGVLIHVWPTPISSPPPNERFGSFIKPNKFGHLQEQLPCILGWPDGWESICFWEQCGQWLPWLMALPAWEYSGKYIWISSIHSVLKYCHWSRLVVGCGPGVNGTPAELKTGHCETDGLHLECVCNYLKKPLFHKQSENYNQ